MDGPPPPPPPHGEKPNTTHGEYRKSSDLPPGNYDIFIIPPHSSGSGFLYLPSLQCQRNSFIAGSVSTLVVVLLWVTLSPIVKAWYVATVASGGGAFIALILALGVGLAGWAFGTAQAGKTQGPRGGDAGPGPGPGASQQSSSGPRADYNARGQGYTGAGAGPQGAYAGGGGGGGAGGGGPQYGGHQYSAGESGPPPNEQPKTSSESKQESKPQSGADWEKAREETRRKEELRRKMEEFKRKREAEAREKQRQREREAMERELRERREQFEREMAAAKEAAAKEARERAEREAAEVRAKAEREAAEVREREAKAAAEARAKAEREAAEARARAEREEAEARARAEEARLRAERDLADAKARAEKEAAEKEAAAKAAAKKEADAKFAALKEAAAKKYAEKKARDAQEAAAKEAAAKEAAAKASSQKSSATTSNVPRTPSPKKAPPRPAASEADDAYSFRPYDRPRRPYAGTTGSPSVYSESSYAPSQSTARTTPPPSTRGRRYETKDPDKIVIRGVYQFNNAFLKTPVAQLVSGQGMVTDGLVLRITTEGLFIDDDVRGVPQREWDVKAWTMKLVEVWCPQYGAQKQPPKANTSFFRRGTGEPTPEESDAYLLNYLKVCKNKCRLASPDNYDPQSLHVLRATIRDQEGRRYVFVLQETEGWKVGIGLQRLRRGTQVRALGVTNMPVNEYRSTLGNLGYV
ncbi:hypothetical protein ATEIFO6365_0006026100 [Aspergillus terreus]|uniref:Uncharacterized protein n=1 Tax=Aspergillus terreus TaxID=33178 RepID=A0A5M3YWD2_ASPTE|nr:hypothetical protein ATETN484_0005025900 [Aspergillus terreus]GFF16924.1 hypothetical protein ATEIFO6365_0006026100 [Aspergillus terreus]